MKLKKILLMLLLCLPFTIFADGCGDNPKNIANSYITGENKYIYTSGSYVGGLLTRSEFKKTYNDNDYAYSYSYLFTGPNYCLSDDDNGVNGTGNNLITDKAMVSEYVISEAKVNGNGTYSNPWYFSPAYNVKLNVMSDDGTISESDDNITDKKTILTLNLTSDETKDIFLQGSYISNSCGFSVTDNKMTIKNVKSDLNCNIYFGIEYNLSYDCNGGNDSIDDTIFACNDPNVTISNETCSKDGFDFKGWSITKDGDTITETKINTIFNTCSDHTLYAKWEHLNCNVTFKKDSNSVYSTLNETYNSTFILPNSEPYKEGYNFAGWFTEETGGTQITTSTINTCNNTTLYAHYEQTNTPKVLVLAENDSKYSLYFMYDNKTYNTNGTYNGKTIVKVINNYVDSSSLTSTERNKVVLIDFDQSFYYYYPTTIKKWFYDYNYVMLIDNINYLNTINVTDMSETFNETGYLTSTKLNIVGLSDWNTSKVTNMKKMFYRTGSGNYCLGCTDGELDIGDISTWNTSNVTDMSYMFSYTGYWASELDIGNIGKWDVSSVTDMSHMFEYMAGASHIYSKNNVEYEEPMTKFYIGDLSNWDVSKVINMSKMFYYIAGNVEVFDIGKLNNWNVSKVTNMESMFNGAGRNSTTWNVGDLSTKDAIKNGVKYKAWNVSKVTDMTYMFASAGYDATTWNIGDLSTWYITSLKSLKGMFIKAGYSSNKFNIGNIGKWNTSQIEDMSYMFGSAGCKSTEFYIGDLSGWNVSKVTDMSYMFGNNDKLTISGGAGANATTWNIGDLSDWNVSAVTDMSYMFNQAGLNSDIFKIGDIGKWDVSKVADMSFMFSYAGKSASNWYIGELDNWNVSNVSNMSGLFKSTGLNDSSWSIGDLSTKTVTKNDDDTYIAWDVSNVKKMSSMFSGTGEKQTEYKIGNLSNWNTSSVTSMGSMFEYAGYYSEIFDISFISNWDVSHVTSMSEMFSSSGVKSETWNVGDLSSWDVSNVINMSNMFYYSGVNSKTWNVGDLSSWNVLKVIYMHDMFGYTGHQYSSSWTSSDVATWYIGDISSWDTSKVESMSFMFYFAGYYANYYLDLSGWNVDLVTSYNYFNSGGIEKKVNPPVWVN